VAQQAACLSRAGHAVVVATGGAQRHSQNLGGVQIESFAVTGADYLLDPINGDVNGYQDFLIHNNWDIVILNAWQNWATDVALKNLDRISGRRFVYSHCVSTNIFFAHRPIRSIIRFISWRPYWRRMKRIMGDLDGVIFLANGGVDSRFDDMRWAVSVGANYHVVPNSLSTSASKSLSHQSPNFHGRDRLIAVGSYQWQKGFDFVMRAYAKSKAKNRIPLHLFGQAKNTFSKQLRLLAVSIGIQTDFIYFNEGISGEALQAEYNQAYLVLSGSHTECQPLALLDASASATPFIARSTGCISGMAGGIAIKEIQDMSYHIDMFLENPEHWQTYSNASLAAAKTLYHPDVVTQELIEVLEMKA
jgi:glycosyltransferase involved in cell wall biosynthesis